MVDFTVKFIFGNLILLIFNSLGVLKISMFTRCFTVFLSAGWIYVLEVILKVYAFGFVNYWRDGQNRFDFVITWVIGKYIQHC